jgi:putative FmdB family regulatory protein
VIDVPIYEYECDACDERFELIEFSDKPEKPKCGAVHKVLAPALKGSGWYVTDTPVRNEKGPKPTETEGERNERPSCPTTASTSTAAAKTTPKPSSINNDREIPGTARAVPILQNGQVIS